MNEICCKMNQRLDVLEVSGMLVYLKKDESVSYFSEDLCVGMLWIFE